MILNWIKYRLASGETRTLRVASAKGQSKGFAAYYGNSEQLMEFSRALGFAFNKTAYIGISHVAAQFADPAGDNWTIERGPGGDKIKRNNKELTTPSEAAVQRALWDFDTEEAEKNGQDSMRAFEFVGGAPDIMVCPIKASTEITAETGYKVQELSQSLGKAAAKFVGSADALTVPLARRLVEVLEPLYHSFKEATRLQEWHAEEGARLERSDSGFLTRLERELELIERIKRVSDPLLDPGLAPNVVREKYQHCTQALLELQERFGLSELPPPDWEWEKLLDHLARLVCYERLVSASEKAHAASTAKLKPIFESYSATIHDLIRSDRDITEELSSCLTAVSSEAHRLSAESERLRAERPKSATRFRDRIPSFGTKPSPNVSIEPPAVAGPDTDLSLVRLTVNQALSKLEELLVASHKARSRHDRALMTIDDYHEKIVSEHGRLKDSWRQQVAAAKLPETITIKGLLALINASGRMQSLNQEREKLKEQLLGQKVALGQLEELIIEWRKITGSQKETPLSTLQILLAEARGIVQYLTKKRAQFEKLKRQEIRILCLAETASNVSHRLAGIQELWQKSFHEFSLQIVPLKGLPWLEFFQTARELIACHQMLDKAGQGFSGNAVFGDPARSLPLTLYFLNQSSPNHQFRRQVVDQVAQAQDGPFTLILSVDPTLVDMLEKLGIPLVEDVKIPAKEAVVVQPALPRNIASTRAEAALDLLKGRPTR